MKPTPIIWVCIGCVAALQQENEPPNHCSGCKGKWIKVVPKSIHDELLEALRTIDKKLEHNVSYPFKQNDEGAVLRGLVDLFGFIEKAIQKAKGKE